MALCFDCKTTTSIPVDASPLSPHRIAGRSASEIKGVMIFHGNRQVPAESVFDIRGDIAATEEQVEIHWAGNLSHVHHIGQAMAAGRIVIQSDTGRRVGQQMSGGTILVQGNVGDYLGAEMTGGTIEVAGNAGDFVGAGLSGSKFGINRGMIVVHGNSGKATGKQMRRGVIFVGGDADRMLGWQMKAGTIWVAGKSSEIGTDMTRGTVIAGQATSAALAPGFSKGGTYRPQVVDLIANWLGRTKLEKSIDLSKFSALKFVHFDGDGLNGGRGEVFLGQS